MTLFELREYLAGQSDFQKKNGWKVQNVEVLASLPNEVAILKKTSTNGNKTACALYYCFNRSYVKGEDSWSFVCFTKKQLEFLIKSFLPEFNNIQRNIYKRPNDQIVINRGTKQ